MLIRQYLLALLAFLVVGCGSSPQEFQPAGGGAAVPPMARVLEPTIHDGVTIPLNRGWNAVGLQGALVTSLEATTSVAGLAFFEGTGYGTRPVNADSVNEGSGTRRGFWIYCTDSGRITYNSTGLVTTLDLKAGWNLAAFPSGVQDLVRPDNVLPQFTEIQPDNTYRTLDVSAGARPQPGRAYWIFAAADTRLTWGLPGSSPAPTPTPTPSPSPSPESGGGGGGGFSPVPAASPSPDASPSPSPDASPSPSPDASPNPSPSPSPSPVRGFMQGWLYPPLPTNSPHQFCAADFNRDGVPDLAQASKNRLSILLGVKGAFRQLNSSLSSFHECLLSRDFNLDGNPDLLLYHSSTRIMLGDGNGGFTGSALPFDANALDSGDLDGDGDHDIVAVSASGSENLITVALNDGTGTTFATTSFTQGADGGYPGSELGLGDVDGDSKLDLIISDNGSTTVTLYPGLGDGSFGVGQVYSKTGNGGDLVVKDFNNDGLADIACYTYSDISVRLADGTGGFGPPSSLPNGSNGPGHSITSGDYNGDGWPDLATYRYLFGTGEVLRVHDGGSTGFSTSYAERVVIGSFHQISTGDVNGDGCDDLLAASNGVFLGRPGYGLFDTFTTSVTGGQSLLAEDFDGDQRAEVIVGFSDGSVTRYSGSSSGSLGAPASLASLGSAVQALASGDINGDGARDLVVALANQQVWALRGLGTGSFASGVQVATAASVPQALLLKDLNSDNKLDLCIAGAALEICYGDGYGAFSSSFGTYATTSAPGTLASADFNGDGKPDLAALDGTLKQVVWLLGQVFSGGTFPVSATPVGLAAADLDGDGYGDVLAACQNQQLSTWWGSASGLAAGTSISPNMYRNSYDLVLGSLNGDSLSDVAVASDNGQVAVAIHAGSRTFGLCRYFAASAASKLALADVTGDGRTDVVYLNSSTLGVLPGL